MLRRRLAVAVVTASLVLLGVGPSWGASYTGAGFSCTTSTGYTYWIRGSAKGYVTHVLKSTTWPQGTFTTYMYKATNTKTQVSAVGGAIFAEDRTGAPGAIDTSSVRLGCGTNAG